MAVSDTEFDRLEAARTARLLFLPATDNVSVRCWVTGSERGRFFDRCPRHCFGRCAERCSGCGCVVRHGCRTGVRLLTSMVGCMVRKVAATAEWMRFTGTLPIALHGALSAALAAAVRSGMDAGLG